MSIENATFVVQRGDEQFSCLGKDLKDKLEDGDMMILQRGAEKRSWVVKAATYITDENIIFDPEAKTKSFRLKPNLNIRGNLVNVESPAYEKGALVFNENAFDENYYYFFLWKTIVKTGEFDVLPGDNSIIGSKQSHVGLAISNRTQLGHWEGHSNDSTVSWTPYKLLIRPISGTDLVNYRSRVRPEWYIANNDSLFNDEVLKPSGLDFNDLHIFKIPKENVYNMWDYVEGGPVDDKPISEIGIPDAQEGDYLWRSYDFGAWLWQVQGGKAVRITLDYSNSHDQDFIGITDDDFESWKSLFLSFPKMSLHDDWHFTALKEGDV